jgi:hypothetical protein
MISINPWSGLPLFQRLAEISAAAKAAAAAAGNDESEDGANAPPPGLYPDDESAGAPGAPRAYDDGR